MAQIRISLGFGQNRGGSEMPCCKVARSRPARLVADIFGVATVEYVILLMLIAVASIGAWVSFGKAVRAQIECAADALEDDEVHCSSGTKPDNGSPVNPTPADKPSSASPAANTLSNDPSQDSAHSTAVSTGTSNSPASTAQSPTKPSPGSDNGSVTQASTPPSGTSTGQPSDDTGNIPPPKPKK